MEAFVSIVNSLGFPVACVIACGWFIALLIKQQREDSAHREDRMYGQMDKFSDTLDKFNETLTKIDTRVAAIENKLDK